MINGNFKYVPKEKPLGIYIHVPFCERKCNYCDFYSVRGDKKLFKKYTDSLIEQIGEYGGPAKRYIVDSLYIGGGTPSYLPAAYYKKIIKALRAQFKFSEDIEFTIEMNPKSLTPRLLKTLKKIGVNRVSLGIQSSNNAELSAIGRLHTFEEAKAAAETLRKYIKNFSCDVMYGLPGQTIKSLTKTLKDVTELFPKHVSVYGLKIEEGTPFAASPPAGLPDEDTERDMYFTAIDYLSDFGFSQYEISNFAKKDFESKHNLKYWNVDEYLGLGPAAASYFDGARFKVCGDVGRFIEFYEGAGQKIIEDYFELPFSEAAGDYVMLRLRLVEGIDTEVFKTRFRKDFDEIFGAKVAKYLDGPYMRKTDKGYALTPAGFYVSNHIIADILDV